MASAKPGNEDLSHQDLGRDEKSKEKTHGKTVCSADLLCDKYPRRKRLQRAWLALPRVIFKVTHRGEMRIKELYRNFNVSFFLSFSAICVNSIYGGAGAGMSKKEHSDEEYYDTSAHYISQLSVHALKT